MGCIRHVSTPPHILDNYYFFPSGVSLTKYFSKLPEILQLNWNDRGLQFEYSKGYFKFNFPSVRRGQFYIASGSDCKIIDVDKMYNAENVNYASFYCVGNTSFIACYVSHETFLPYSKLFTILQRDELCDVIIVRSS